MNLALMWTLQDDRIEPIDYTFSSLTSGTLCFSSIGHFAASQHMLNGLVSAGVIHDGSNLSNHSPIYTKFDLGNIELKMKEFMAQSKISWNNASVLAKDNFKKFSMRSLRILS